MSRTEGSAPLPRCAAGPRASSHMEYNFDGRFRSPGITLNDCLKRQAILESTLCFHLLSILSLFDVSLVAPSWLEGYQRPSAQAAANALFLCTRRFFRSCQLRQLRHKLLHGLIEILLAASRQHRRINFLVQAPKQHIAFGVAHVQP